MNKELARTFDRHASGIEALLCQVADELVAWFQAGLKHLGPLVIALGTLSCRANESIYVIVQFGGLWLV